MELNFDPTAHGNWCCGLQVECIFTLRYKCL